MITISGESIVSQTAVNGHISQTEKKNIWPLYVKLHIVLQMLFASKFPECQSMKRSARSSHSNLPPVTQLLLTYQLPVSLSCNRVLEPKTLGWHIPSTRLLSMFWYVWQAADKNFYVTNKCRWHMSWTNVGKCEQWVTWIVIENGL